MKLYYEDIGSGEVILFIHGWAASSRFWRFQIEHLSMSYRCIAPDWPGFGRSKCDSNNLTLEQVAISIADLLKYLKISRYHVVGHSMGGMVAGFLFAMNSKAVKSITIANCPLNGKNSLYNWQRFLLVFPLRSTIYFFSKIRFMRYMFDKDFKLFSRIDRKIADDVIKSQYRFSISTLFSLLNSDITSIIKSSDIPLLIFSSENEQVFKKSSIAEIPRIIPTCNLHEFRGIGHNSMLENPKEFNIELERFLSIIPAQHENRLSKRD